MELVPTGAALGVEIRGVNIRRPLPLDVAEAIRDAWLDNLVFIVREQPMTDAQLMAFTGNFGQLEVSAGHLVNRQYGTEGVVLDAMKSAPEIAVISNIKEGGKAIGVLGDGEAKWHTDSSYVDVPTAGSFLHAIEIPPSGGATYFANMYAALETLPDDLRAAVDGKSILHPASHRSDGSPYKGFENVTDITQLPGATHPIVRTHPETRRKALYLGRRLYAHIPGMPVAESDRLLDALWAHATQDRFVYRHDWRVGDLVVWDNRCVIHRRDPFDPGARRLMHRAQTRGSAPY